MGLLGTQTKDTVTGFAGYIMARTEYLNGCVQYLVQPEGLKPDGSPMASEWFDEQRLAIASGADAGGPQKTPPGLEHP